MSTIGFLQIHYNKCILAFLLCSSLLSACKNSKIKPAFSNNSKSLISKSVGMKFTLIQPGTFLMGAPESEYLSDSNEYPQHTVVLTKPYYMGVYEVTQEEFFRVKGFNPSTLKGAKRLPVETVTWYDAILFCNRLSILDKVDSCYEILNIKTDGIHTIHADVHLRVEKNGYRLPTEAEWEFACRGGTTTPFPFGDNITTIQANYDGYTPYFEKEKKEVFRDKSLEVDSLLANRFGLYNIVGNVFEWCWDYYGEYSGIKQTDPVGPSAGNERVRRSGAYTSPAHHMRSSVRHGIPPGVPFFHMGFRVSKNCNH
jgi:formylglycine-generating enzyme required for sulfatase activity